MGGAESIALALSILMAVVGVSSYYASRKDNEKDEVKESSEWRGRVDGKLDSILGLTARVDKLEDVVRVHDTTISKLADSTTRVHERLDIILGGRDGQQK